MQGNFFMNFSKFGCICNCTTVSIVSIWIMSVFRKLVLNEFQKFVTGNLTDTCLRHDLNQWSEYSPLDLLVSFFPVPSQFTLTFSAFLTPRKRSTCFYIVACNSKCTVFPPNWKRSVILWYHLKFSMWSTPRSLLQDLVILGF